MATAPQLPEGFERELTREVIRCKACGWECGYSMLEAMKARGISLFALAFHVCSAANREHYAGAVQAIEAAKWVPKITDTDLHAECERRGFPTASIAKWDDATLRAECGRRFAGPVNEYTRLRESIREFSIALRMPEGVDALSWAKEHNAAVDKTERENGDLRERVAELERLATHPLITVDTTSMPELAPGMVPGSIVRVRVDARTCRDCGSRQGVTEGWISRGGQCPGCCPSCARVGSTLNHSGHDPEEAPRSIEVEHTPDSGRGLAELALPRPEPRKLEILDEATLADLLAPDA